MCLCDISFNTLKEIITPLLTWIGWLKVEDK